VTSAARCRRCSRSATCHLARTKAALGYEVLPSEANFFMVGLKREASEVAPEFQKRDVLVGRPFPR
jgi:histidinol-phosphate/aromatic aminotransferase/cobyric acid decarboxylase-like protein